MALITKVGYRKKKSVRPWPRYKHPRKRQSIAARRHQAHQVGPRVLLGGYYWELDWA
ncbi:MAG TPA: hypothetical protein VKD23_13780 [Terriglobales bacterium]|nr:hypothetical protein [Terriglobales bacterium]